MIGQSIILSEIVPHVIGHLGDAVFVEMIAFIAGIVLPVDADLPPVLIEIQIGKAAGPRVIADRVEPRRIVAFGRAEAVEDDLDSVVFAQLQDPVHIIGREGFDLLALIRGLQIIDVSCIRHNVFTDQISHIVLADTRLRPDGLPQVVISADGEMILEEFRHSGPHIRDRVICPKEHVRLYEDQAGMLIVKSVL